MLDLQPLSSTFAARVGGIDLNDDLPDALRQELRGAFLEHKVLVFEDQSLTSERFAEVAEIFGKPQPVYRTVIRKDITQPAEGVLTRVVHDAASPGAPDNFWHNDSTQTPDPEMGAILRAIELPSSGGDTLFADMNAAFSGLQPDLRSLVEDAKAVHDVMVMARYTDPDVERIVELHRAFPPVVHPVVRTHPETGKKGLFVSSVWTSHIVGMTRERSDEVLRTLFDQPKRPEYQFRHSWKPGSIVVWDNRIVQHYAVADYGDSRRVMERVSLEGDRPF